MTETQKIFISNLKRFRKRLGLSQMKLAELCGISTSYIGEIEIGRKYPSVETFEKIANALHVEPYKLIMGDESFQNYDRNDLILVLSEKIKKGVSDTIDAVAGEYITQTREYPIAAEKIGKKYSE